ncbi:MAG: hypothetical protein IAE91_04365 [Ignavibacteriaceae bacterium]|nr:hypothetical protein [Ignavibacteriaceae bacterium]
MKTMLKLALLIPLLVMFFSTDAEANRYNNRKFNYFYKSLRYDGSWIEMDRGFYVWKPRVYDYNWRPYANGNWIWTSEGWYWNSYESFGHIVYHYGRWYNDPYYGWVWVPGYQWAPAWVEWRYFDNYIGWAPLHPYVNFSIHTGIFISNTYYLDLYYWNYVNVNNFCNNNLYNHYVDVYKIRDNHYKTRSDYGARYENERVVNRGVEPSEIERRTGQRVVSRDIIREDFTGDRTRGVEVSDSRIVVRNDVSGSRDINDRSYDNADYEIKRAERSSSIETRNIDESSRSVDIKRDETTVRDDSRNNQNSGRDTRTDNNNSRSTEVKTDNNSRNSGSGTSTKKEPVIDNSGRRSTETNSGSTRSSGTTTGTTGRNTEVKSETRTNNSSTETKGRTSSGSTSGRNTEVKSETRTNNSSTETKGRTTSGSNSGRNTEVKENRSTESRNNSNSGTKESSSSRSSGSSTERNRTR